jgi:hypothetical protein
VFAACLGCTATTGAASHAPPTPSVGFATGALIIAPPPLYLEVWATVHGTTAGAFHANIALHSGDRIGLQARTSIAANVYLLHCDAKRVLSVFPSAGPLRFDADRRVSLPVAGMDIHLEGSTGRETLYVVASRRPLDQSDPDLYAALARAASSENDPLCSAHFEALCAGENVVRAQAVRATLRGVEVSSSYDSVARAFAEADGVIVLRFPFRHLP